MDQPNCNKPVPAFVVYGYRDILRHKEKGLTAKARGVNVTNKESAEVAASWWRQAYDVAAKILAFSNHCSGWPDIDKLLTWSPYMKSMQAKERMFWYDLHAKKNEDYAVAAPPAPFASLYTLNKVFKGLGTSSSSLGPAPGGPIQIINPVTGELTPSALSPAPSGGGGTLGNVRPFDPTTGQPLGAVEPDAAAPWTMITDSIPGDSPAMKMGFMALLAGGIYAVSRAAR